MTRPEELINLQIRLEYALDRNDRLVPFPGSSEQGQYILYRYAGGYKQYFNHTLPEELCARLEEMGGERAFGSPTSVENLMQEYLPAKFEGLFVSEHIARLPDPAEFPLVVTRDGQCLVLVDGKPVCWAWSERSNASCAEVAVETLPEHRHQGFARQAVAAWAHAVLKSGRAAFYSYKAENEPSRALARSLGGEWYADVVGYA